MSEFEARDSGFEKEARPRMATRVRNAIPELPQLKEPAWREFTLLTLTLLAVFLACYQPIWDPDTYWHLAIGREIWQTHHLVGTETFSFTARGVPWVDTEWLFHVFAYPLWKLFGYTGLSIFTAFMASLVVAALYRSVRLVGGSAMSLCFYVLVLMGGYQSRIRFRPDLFSLLFIAILVEGLLRWKPDPPRVGRFWIFSALLFWIWAQFHGGWAYGLALLGVCILGMVLDSFRDKTFSFRYMLNLGLTGLVSVAALFVNPYGWKIPWFPVKSLIGFRNPRLVQIVEWNRTPWHGSFGVFVAVLLVSAFALLLSWRRLTWKKVLWAGSQVFLGLYWVRYVAYAVVAMTTIVTERMEGLLRWRGVRTIAWGSALFSVVLASAYYYSVIPVEWDLSHKYPVQETRFLIDHRISGNIFNTYVTGGYLDWYAYPVDRIFMDGRYYPFTKPMNEYWQAVKTVFGYEKLLDSYPIDIVLYPTPNFTLRDRKLPGHPRRGASIMLFPRDRWALVDFGNYGLVLLKREPRYKKVINEFEYRALSPDDLQYLVKAAREGRVDRTLLRHEIDRKLRQDPWTSWRPRLANALKQIGGGQ